MPASDSAPGTEPAFDPRAGSGAVERTDAGLAQAAASTVFQAPAAAGASGELSMSIPLPVAPARGAAPSLELVYASSAGPSLFGHGWSLPLSSIGPDLKLGYPRYDGRDVFALDGERLARVAAGAQTVALAGVQYRAERFEPRLNGDLVRVDRLTRIADGAVHWRVYLGDGGVRVYGQDAEARIADPRDPGRVYRWLLERSYSPRGDCTAYVYAPETASGRRGGGQVSNRHIKAIRYGALTAYDPQTEALPAFAFQTVFDYGDHDPDTPAPEPDRDWALRPDPYSDRRGGFEAATARLCRRVLLFHHLPELGPEPVLTRAVVLTHALAETQSLLREVRHEGFVREGAGYRREAAPSQVFEYTRFDHRAGLSPLTGADGAPVHAGAAALRFADLEAAGLPGLLSEQGRALQYAANRGDGVFAPAAALAQSPVGAGLRGGRLSIERIDRSGREALVVRSAERSGFYPIRRGGGLGAFQAFQASRRPGRAGRSALSFDADGDGFGDTLLLQEAGAVLVRGAGAAGDHPPEAVTGAPPAPVRSKTCAVLLADMTGDGLTDLVEVRAQSISYRPGLGHGRFGEPVVMETAPRLASADSFHPDRVRLASLSGAGPADLVYADGRGLRYALNRGGAAFSPVREISGETDGADLAVLDLLGRGAPSICARIRHAGGHALAHASPAGAVRPFLLTRVENGFGAEARIAYRSSAELAAEALARGAPWRSTPPFPVQCVTAIVRRDRLRETRTEHRYAYADAHYDPEDRTFCGFARVDDWDVSESDLNRRADRADDPAFQPPLHRRRWYDTGLPADDPISAEHLRADWWAGDADWRPAIPPAPAGLTETEARRARRGALLREEVYELSGGPDEDVPIRLRTLTAGTVRLHPGLDGAPAVMRAAPEESLDADLRGDPAEPRRTHTLTLARNAFGQTERSASIAYGRRTPDPGLPPEVQADQARTLIDVAVHEFTDDSELGARAFLRRRAWRRRAFILQGAILPPGAPATPAMVRAAFDSAPDLAFEAPTGTATGKRLTSEARDAFFDDALQGPLEFGRLGRWNEIARRYDLALTPGLRAAAWGPGFAGEADLAAAGYADLDGDGRSWAVSGRRIHAAGAASRFLTPDAVEDAAGVRVDYTYDAHRLHVVEERDSLGNTRSFEIDYRIGAPGAETDANGTTVRTRFDALGRVAAVAISGPDGEGDTPAAPTAAYVYDFDAWRRDQTPASQHSWVREIHGDPDARRHERIHYLDGEGVTLQSRETTAPGLADRLNGAGAVTEIDTGGAPRWRVSGKARLTNKAARCGRFDPWFSDAGAYDGAPALTERGGATLVSRDGEGAVLRTDYADGTFDRNDQTPWRSFNHDRNDTVQDSAWYAANGAPDPAGPEPGGAGAHAAWAAARCHGTFDESHFDPGGVTIFERQRLETGAARTVRIARTPGGHRLESFDTDGRRVSARRTDLMGRVLLAETMEDGATLILPDAAGRPLRTRRPDGVDNRILRDAAGRLLGVETAAPGEAPQVASLTVYGDGHPQAAARRMRGRPFAVFDGSGATVFEQRDFKGRVTRSTKRFLSAPLDGADWTNLAALAPDAALAAADSRLDAEAFTSVTEYDALGRATGSTAPDGTQTRPRYAAGGDATGLFLTPGAGGAEREVIAGHTFDAWGGRESLSLGDGTVTRWTRDPHERRVTRLEVERSRDARRLIDAAYTYDPVGHVTGLADAASQTLYFSGAAVTGDMRFEYDALHRLVSATGRELASLSDAPLAPVPGAPLPHPGNAAAVRRYRRRYAYDIHDNIEEIRHTAGAFSQVRRFRYEADTNRLSAASAPGDGPGVFSLSAAHDAHGRMISGPGLIDLAWTSGGQLASLDLGGGGRAHYVAGAAGARVRKIIRRPGGLEEDHLYLGAVDIHRTRRNGVLVRERHTFKVMVAGRLVLRAETKILDADDATGLNTPLLRYRHSDQTRSLSVETAEDGSITQAESFHPYGSTAFRSAISEAETSLTRYRYADRERDEESGLTVMGHRLLHAWLGRFISPDPAGPVGGANTFAYAGGDPINFWDPGGLQDAATQSDHTEWDYEELQRQARALGRELDPRVTPENYRDQLIDGVWKVLAPLGDDTSAPEDGAPPGPGGETEGEDARAPPDPAPGAGGGSEHGDGGGETGDSGDAADEAGDAPGDSGSGTGGDSEAGGDDEDRSPLRNPGASAVSGYNSHVRSQYAKGNIERAVQGVREVEDAISRGSADDAWRAAREASQARDDARLRTQQRLRWTGAKGLSELIDQGRSFTDIRNHYSQGDNKPLKGFRRLAWNVFTPGLPEHNPGPRGSGWRQVTRDIAIGSGKTNRIMSGFSKAGRVLGPIGTVAGVGIGIKAVYDASPEDRARVASGETGGFIGGALGFAGGTAATAAAIGFFVSNPAGWVAGAVTLGVLAGGAIGGYFGAEAGRALFELPWSD